MTENAKGISSEIAGRYNNRLDYSLKTSIYGLWNVTSRKNEGLPPDEAKMLSAPSTPHIQKRDTKDE